tara:strand:+ start:227 stop:988 length:762 start_codon:yes stop_codon:yes gene_type:complete
MTTKKKNDLPQYVIGVLIIGFIAWQLIGYLLPDEKPNYTTKSFMQAIEERSGGADRWNTIQKISFTKKFQLLDSTGHIEIDRLELHTYNFTYDTQRQIQWDLEGDNFLLVQQNNLLFQSKNKVIDSTITQAALSNKLNAATFVLGLPYTLNSPTASLSYLGLQTFEGVSAHELKASFENSKDIWRLYYSEETLDWLGYWVETSDHYSLVINDVMTEAEGFSLSRKRTSYRTNAQKEKLYIRARYTYDNYKITP